LLRFGGEGQAEADDKAKYECRFAEHLLPHEPMSRTVEATLRRRLKGVKQRGFATAYGGKPERCRLSANRMTAEGR
jgi:hypothetical protein